MSAVQAIQRSGASLTLTWTAVAGQTYQLQNNSDPSSTNWSNFGGALVALAGYYFHFSLWLTIPGGALILVGLSLLDGADEEILAKLENVPKVDSSIEPKVSSRRSSREPSDIS